MKQKSLFDGPAKRPDRRPHRPNQTEDGQTRWIKARAAVLVRFRGLDQAEAEEQARREIAEYTEELNRRAT